MINLYNIDCMEFMKNKPDKFYDIAIVDPPYGINSTKMQMGTNLNRKNDGYPGVSTSTRLRQKGRLNSGGGKLKNRLLNQSNCDWDSSIPEPEYFTELFRVSKDQIIWGGNYFPLPPSRGMICWDKLQPWENFSQFELAWTSFDKPAAIFRFSNTGGANSKKKIHPTQKPVALYSWLLTKYAKKGDKLLDTHGGSMSSAIAAYELGFDIDICEINKEYFEQAEIRVKEAMKQQMLFTNF